MILQLHVRLIDSVRWAGHSQSVIPQAEEREARYPTCVLLLLSLSTLEQTTDLLHATQDDYRRASVPNTFDVCLGCVICRAVALPCAEYALL